MTDVIEMAAKLGETIARSSQALGMREARKALNAHGEAMGLLKQFQQQSARIADLQKNDKPVEVADKHKLDELHQKLVSTEVFKKFTAAQVEYVDMMRKVNEAISQALAAVEG